ESTATLKDDIALSKTLIQLHRRQLAEARKRLQDTKTRAAEMAKLTREIRDEQAHLDDLVRQQKEGARAAAQQRNADRLESLALAVQIAETTGNKAKEEKALNAEIRELERQIR